MGSLFVSINHKRKGSNILNKALRILNKQSSWEDFSELVDSPGWDFINKQKLSPIQKFCSLALAHNAATPEDLIEQAGLFGAAGLCPCVKIFWRNVAHKVAYTGKYNPIFKERLDSEYKRNESRQNSNEGIVSSTEGKLPLSQLKLRARAYTLSVFLRDLTEAIRNDF